MFAKRSFINYLRQFNEFITVDEVDQLIENLTAYRHGQHEKIDDLRHILRRHFNIDIPEDEMPDISLLDRASEQLGRWSSHPELMRDWFHWSEYGDLLKTMGLGCVVDVLATRSYDISALRNAFLKALFKYKADVKIKGSDTLATFEGMLFDEKIAAYRLSDRRIPDHHTQGAICPACSRNPADDRQHSRQQRDRASQPQYKQWRPRAVTARSFRPAAHTDAAAVSMYAHESDERGAIHRSVGRQI